jgi:hypothetical protein
VLDSLYLFPIALAAYYVCVWLLLTRKTADKSIVVCYRAPANLSPAAIRYIVTRGCDGRTFVAILAQLASCKLLAITPDETRATVHLSKLRDDHRILAQLPEEERIVFKHIFEWEDRIELAAPDWKLIEKIKKPLQVQLSKYVGKNPIYIIAALLLTGAASVWMCLLLGLFGKDPFERTIDSGFAGLTVAVFAAAAAYLWDSNLQAVKLALRGLYHRRTLLFLAFLILLFPAMWYLLMRTVSPGFANVTGLLMFINVVGSSLLPAYTAPGRRLLSEIKGFRQFLRQAEQDRLQRLNPPGQQARADQEYVPYAIALDVREDWGDELGIRAMVETAL